jgi:hypothetical protein
MPCSQKRARLLLERGRAVAVRRYPFTIRLRVKLDPGSKTTGIALVADADGNKPAKVLALLKSGHGFQTGDIVRAELGRARQPEPTSAALPFAPAGRSTCKRQRASFRASMSGIAHLFTVAAATAIGRRASSPPINPGVSGAGKFDE